MKKRIRKLVRRIQKKLLLNLWTVEIYWDDDPDAEAFADIKIIPLSRRAAIHYNLRAGELHEESEEYVITHELLHIAIAPLMRINAQWGDTMDADNKKLFLAQCEEAEEMVVDHLARVLST